MVFYMWGKHKFIDKKKQKKKLIGVHFTWKGISFSTFFYYKFIWKDKQILIRKSLLKICNIVIAFLYFHGCCEKKKKIEKKKKLGWIKALAKEANDEKPIAQGMIIQFIFSHLDESKLWCRAYKTNEEDVSWELGRN